MDAYEKSKKKSIALSSGIASQSNGMNASSQNAYPLTGAGDGVGSINAIVAGIKGDISNL